MKKSYITSTFCIILLLLSMGIAGQMVISSYTFRDYAANAESRVFLLLSPDADSLQVANIAQELKSDKGVVNFEYFDSPDASYRLEKMTGFVEDSLGAPIILPAIFAITTMNDESASVWEKAGAKFQGVKGTYLNRNAEEQLTLIKQISQNKKTLGIVLLCTLTMVLYFVIHLSIKGSVKKIQTMQLVGARNSFIKRPFIRRAIFLGFIAAIVASALLLILTLNNSGWAIQNKEFIKTLGVVVSAFCVAGVTLCTLFTTIALAIIVREK